MLADEPTGALDTRTGEEVMDLLTELVEDQGITVILVTHEQEIADYAHRVIRMRDGGIVEDTAFPRSQATNGHTPDEDAAHLEPIAPRPLGVDAEPLRRAAEQMPVTAIEEIEA